MANRIHERWPENPASKHLLIVGCAPRRGELPRWRYFMFEDCRWVEVDRE